MALADPQSVTYDGVALSLPRISTGTNAGTYSYLDSTKELDLDISHSYGRRTRRLARLTLNTVQSNPFLSGASVAQKSIVYLVVDTPADFGVQDPSVAVKQVKALTAWLTASTDANSLNLVKGLN